MADLGILPDELREDIGVNKTSRKEGVRGRWRFRSEGATARIVRLIAESHDGITTAEIHGIAKIDKHEIQKILYRLDCDGMIYREKIDNYKKSFLTDYGNSLWRESPLSKEASISI